MSASAANLPDSSVISDADRLSSSTADGTSEASAVPSRAGSDAEPGTSGHVMPVIRLTSCSQAAISASRLASSAAARLTVSRVSAVSQSSGSPGGLHDRCSSSAASSGGVGRAGQPGGLSERRVDLGHAVQRVQRGCRLVQARVQ